MCPSVHVKVTFVFYFFHHMGLGKEVSLPDDILLALFCYF